MDFDSVFHPTDEQRQRQNELIAEVLKESVARHSCSCCEYGLLPESSNNWWPDIECVLDKKNFRTEDHCDGFLLCPMCKSLIERANNTGCEPENTE